EDHELRDRRAAADGLPRRARRVLRPAGARVDDGRGQLALAPRLPDRGGGHRSAIRARPPSARAPTLTGSTRAPGAIAATCAPSSRWTVERARRLFPAQNRTASMPPDERSSPL